MSLKAEEPRSTLYMLCFIHIYIKLINFTVHNEGGSCSWQTTLILWCFRKSSWGSCPTKSRCTGTHGRATTHNVQAQLSQAGFPHVLAGICQMQSSTYRHTMDINRQGEIQRNNRRDSLFSWFLSFQFNFFFPFCLFKFKTHSFSFQESIFTVWWWGAVADKVWNKTLLAAILWFICDSPHPVLSVRCYPQTVWDFLLERSSTTGHRYIPSSLHFHQLILSPYYNL